MRIDHTARGRNPWEDSESFALSKAWFSPLMVAALAETLFYGIHIVLFVMASSVLLKKGGRTQIASFWAMTVMFGLATADVGYSYHLYLNRMDEILAGNSVGFLKMVYPKFLIHLINNLMADILLIMRCYMIWGESRVLAYVTGSVLFVGTVLGFIGEGTTSAKLKILVVPYIIMIVGLNVTLTLLTAWKIWWISREVSRIMGRRVQQGFSVAVGILLETGFIYSMSSMLVLMLSQTKYVVAGAAIAIRAVCIMPIFIVVQVALGRGTKNLNASVSEARSRSNDVQLTTAIHFATSVSGGGTAAESRDVHQ